MRQIDLVAQAVDALTDVDDDLAHALVDEIIDPFWDGYEPTDDEMTRTSRPTYDLDGYSLSDPKRVALQREMDR